MHSECDNEAFPDDDAEICNPNSHTTFSASHRNPSTLETEEQETERQNTENRI